MSSKKSRFICNECGTVALKWSGKCQGCGAWNSIVEESIEEIQRTTLIPSSSFPEKLTDIDIATYPRISTGIEELDRVFGGGLIPGSVSLIGGQPGIGKSTLLLQVAQGICNQGKQVLYISGEESPKQIRLRATRLEIDTPNLLVLAETELSQILNHSEELKPDLIIIDSIQTMFASSIESAPGSVSQVRECTAQLVRMAKGLESSLIIIGHVTKDGALAGPRVLEHLVDTVLYFEGENIQNFRIIKSVKNRFGSTNEIGIFEMVQSGLRPITNPSEYFIGQRAAAASGTAIIPIIEGTRAILVEIQALVSKSYYPSPTRKTKGIDNNRLAMLIAVLEKRAEIPLSSCDVYLNVAGGLDVDEPAVDLGAAMAIVSAYSDIPLKPDSVFSGEIGLNGEIRGVSFFQRRLTEAERLGFKNIILPEHNYRSISVQNTKIKLTPLNEIKDAVHLLLNKINRKT